MKQYSSYWWFLMLGYEYAGDEEVEDPEPRETLRFRDPRERAGLPREGSDEWLWQLYVDQEDAQAEDDSLLYHVPSHYDAEVRVGCLDDLHGAFDRRERLEQEHAQLAANRAYVLRIQEGVNQRRREREAHYEQVSIRQEHAAREAAALGGSQWTRGDLALLKAGFTLDPGSEAWLPPEVSSPGARSAAPRCDPSADHTLAQEPRVGTLE